MVKGHRSQQINAYMVFTIWWVTINSDMQAACTTGECNKLIRALSNAILSVWHHMHGNIYQILLIMSSLLPWVWPTPTLCLHDIIPCMDMSQLISPLQYLPFKVFFTLSWCTNLYVSFFIATPGMYKEFQRKLCQNQWMVKATSAAECYSWLYEGGGGKINMSFAWT